MRFATMEEIRQIDITAVTMSLDRLVELAKEFDLTDFDPRFPFATIYAKEGHVIFLNIGRHILVDDEKNAYRDVNLEVFADMYFIPPERHDRLQELMRDIGWISNLVHCNDWPVQKEPSPRNCFLVRWEPIVSPRSPVFTFKACEFTNRSKSDVNLDRKVFYLIPVRTNPNV